MRQSKAKPLQPNPLQRGKRATLSAANRRTIEREAKAIGLSTNEYMRLIIGLASSLRESFGETSNVDGRQLLLLVENPIFIAVLKTVVQSVALSDEMNDDEQPSTKPANNMPESRPQQSLPHPYYGYPVNPYHPLPQHRPMQQAPLAQAPNTQLPNYLIPSYPRPMPQQPLPTRPPNPTQS